MAIGVSIASNATRREWRTELAWREDDETIRNSHPTKLKQVILFVQGLTLKNKW